MGQLGYVISREDLQDGRRASKYYKQDLELMTTHQLREICRKEKIIQGVINPMDKDDLIRVVLRYRGADERLLIQKENLEGQEALQGVISKVHVAFRVGHPALLQRQNYCLPRPRH